MNEDFTDMDIVIDLEKIKKDKKKNKLQRKIQAEAAKKKMMEDQKIERINEEKYWQLLERMKENI